MTTYQRQPSYRKQPPPAPQPAPYNHFNPNMPPAPIPPYNDYGTQPVLVRQRTRSQSSQRSQLSAPFHGGSPVAPSPIAQGAPGNPNMPPNQLAMYGRQPSASGLRPSSAGNGYAYGGPVAAPVPMQPPVTSAPSARRSSRSSQDSHRSHHSYRSHHDFPDQIDESPERNMRPERRPTLGDSLMMILESFKGVLSSKRS